MYDRPSSTELLEAAGHHLQTEVLPVAKATNGKLYFQTLVALNVLSIVGREIQLRGTHLRAEWARLNMLLGGEPLPESEDVLEARLAERNADLCAAIRAGEYDDSQPLFEHLKATTIEQLEVANPKFLQTLAKEDALS